MKADDLIDRLANQFRQINAERYPMEMTRHALRGLKLIAEYQEERDRIQAELRGLKEAKG